MTTRVIIGDCLDVLADLPAGSVQCCVTSPPYFGLRSYLPDDHPDKAREIGTEQTPAEYVAKLVKVFRGVRRVLRDDGTLWLNLGTSYAGTGTTGGGTDGARRGREGCGATSPSGKGTWKSPRAYGDTRAIQSRRLQSDPACDTRGTEPLGCSAPDCAYRDRDDGFPGGSESRHGRSADTGQRPRDGVEPPCTTDHDSGHLDCASASPDASPPVAPASNSSSSLPRAQGASVPASEASARRKNEQTAPRDAHLSEHRSACTCGTASTSHSSCHRKSGKASSDSACGDPSCNGRGCGVCWSYLAIPPLNIKPKDEINTPHLVAMALQADGWYLRQTIVWSKKNPMPESIKDRCTKAHEYVFLLAKSERYFWDAAAVAEVAAPETAQRYAAGYKNWGKGQFLGSPTDKRGPKEIKASDLEGRGTTRNRRSVWSIATQTYSGAHYATFPPALVEPCILAGSRPGDTVLDPFGGTGTVGSVAAYHDRRAVLIDINPANEALMGERLEKHEAPLFDGLVRPVQEAML